MSDTVDQSPNNNKPSPTAYDDTFRTLVTKGKELVIPVVNELFSEKYSGKEEINSGNNEFFKNKNGSKQDKRITDSNFFIINQSGISKKYHIECQSDESSSDILPRMFEYDAMIASGDYELKDNALNVFFPNSGVIFLRSTKNTPDTMSIDMVTSDTPGKYTVPILKVQEYTIDDIFNKNLLFIIPFYIFRYDKKLEKVENDPQKLAYLEDEYKEIIIRLNSFEADKKISYSAKHLLFSLTIHVVALFAQNYKNISKGVSSIMKGSIVNCDVVRIWDEAATIYGEELRKKDAEFSEKLRKKDEDLRKKDEDLLNERVETAKNLLRNNVDRSIIVNSLKLPKSRIDELAREVGKL